MTMTTQTDLLSEKNRVENFIQQGAHQLSSFSFVNIFLWKDFFDFTFEIIEGNLCVFAASEAGSFLYLPPLGEKISPRAVEESFQRMRADNQGRGVSRVENVEPDHLGAFDPARFSYFKKAEEYVYSREDIVQFRGNDYKSKRSSYNYFLKNYRHDFLPFERTMVDECAQLYDQWAEGKMRVPTDEIFKQMVEENRSVHQLVFEFYQELGLIGRVVLVDGEIKGYTFGYPLNGNTFCVLSEITDVSVKGLATFIFSEFCRDRKVQPFNLVNTMDDFGMENVRRTKISFRPVQTIAAYVVNYR